MSRKRPNYEVVVKEGLGLRSEILDEPIQKRKVFESVLEVLSFIEREATVHGWRDFTLTTVGDSLSGIPLGEKT